MLGIPDMSMKYMTHADASDSSEEEMDMSDSDREEGEIGGVGLDGNVESEATEPPTKRQALESMKKNGMSEPKWSNPDPYYVLPPVDESLSRKRKDPVKEIRKSRKKVEENTAAGSHSEEAINGESFMGAKAAVINQVAANDDFISFEIDGGENLSDSDEKSGEDGGIGVPGAPTGPRQFNEQQNGRYSPPPVNEFQSSRYSPPPAEHSYSTTNQRLERKSTLTSPAHPLSPTIPTQVILDTAYGAGTKHSYGDSVDLKANRDFSLGNRKRNHDDEIRGPGRPGQKGKAGTPSGYLLESWIPDRSTDPLPWLRRPEYITAQAGFRLHKELCDFYDFVRPQKYETIVREELLHRLQAAVNREMPKCNVHCFGSFAAGLYLPNADMDVVILSDNFVTRGEKVVCQSNSKMRKFGDFVTRSGLAQPGSVEVIFGAKVPLVKFVDRVTSIRIDVSFENDTGIIANKTFSTWKQQFPAMPVLVTIIKQFLMMRGLNEVMNGGIGGFSVTCLVTSLLQNMPRVQTGEMIPEDHLGELLIEFLDFYGNRLDISRTGLTMNPPGYFDKVSVPVLNSWVLYPKF